MGGYVLSSHISISACLIVHNVSSVLERCLYSIKDFADEICIVDSGSDDDTVDIARQIGARIIIDRSLADSTGRMRDFAAARNTVLRMAHSRWVLSIDADEVFKLTQPDKIYQLLRNKRLHAIEMPILSGGVHWHLPRLFLRKPWTCWHERVHEWVEIRGPVRRTNSASIENLPDKKGKESASYRDLRLCKLLLDENPDNLRGVFYLARALRHLNRFRDALPYYDRYWRKSDFRAGRYVAAIGAAICYLMLHDFKASRCFAMRAYRLDPQLAEACCLLGDISLGIGRPDLAKSWFERAITKQIPKNNYPLFIDPSSYGDYPNSQLQWINNNLPV